MKKIILFAIVSLLVVGGIFAWQQYTMLNRAHSTFENYYAFRGCTELLDKTDTYADCKTGDGKTIKIVKINDKWYLEGDGPGMW